MTEDVATTEAEKLPPGHYYTSILGRMIEVREINPAQAMILGKIYRNVDNLTEMGETLNFYGRVGTIFDSLIVKPEDLEFLEDAILSGKLGVADFAQVFITHVSSAPTTGPQKPRRGRK